MRHIASGYTSLVLPRYINLWPHGERSIAVMTIIKSEFLSFQLSKLHYYGIRNTALTLLKS